MPAGAKRRSYLKGGTTIKVRQDERVGSLIANAHPAAVNVQARYRIGIQNTGSSIMKWVGMSSEVSARW